MRKLIPVLLFLFLFPLFTGMALASGKDDTAPQCDAYHFELQRYGYLEARQVRTETDDTGAQDFVVSSEPVIQEISDNLQFRQGANYGIIFENFTSSNEPVQFTMRSFAHALEGTDRYMYSKTMTVNLEPGIGHFYMVMNSEDLIGRHTLQILINGCLVVEKDFTIYR